jgi:hypothetical protein
MSFKYEGLKKGVEVTAPKNGSDKCTQSSTEVENTRRDTEKLIGC